MPSAPPASGSLARRAGCTTMRWMSSRSTTEAFGEITSCMASSSTGRASLRQVDDHGAAVDGAARAARGGGIVVALDVQLHLLALAPRAAEHPTVLEVG